MSRAPIIGGVVLLVIAIVVTIFFVMGGDEPTLVLTPGPSYGPAPQAPAPQAPAPQAPAPQAPAPQAQARQAQDPQAPAPQAPAPQAPAPQAQDPQAPAHPSDVTPPPSDETPGDATTGMLKCVNTRRRDEMGWVGKGRWTTEEKAREVCKDYEYMSLECPMESGFEVFCANDISLAQTLLNRECKGDVEGTEIAGGTNLHCSGPYKWGMLDAGGANRAAVYKI